MFNQEKEEARNDDFVARLLCVSDLYGKRPDAASPTIYLTSGDLFGQTGSR